MQFLLGINITRPFSRYSLLARVILVLRIYLAKLDYKYFSDFFLAPELCWGSSGAGFLKAREHISTCSVLGFLLYRKSVLGFH